MVGGIANCQHGITGIRTLQGPAASHHWRVLLGVLTVAVMGRVIGYSRFWGCFGDSSIAMMDRAATGVWT